MATVPSPAAVLAAAPIAKIIEVLKVRCSWPVMKELLAEKTLKPGAGYPDLIGRAQKGNADSPVIAALARKTYLDIVVAGERYVQIYVLSKDVIQSVVSKLKTATVSASPFTKSYPLPLEPSDLSMAPTDLTLCEIRNLSDEDYQLVFCSKRLVEEKTSFDGRSNPQVMAAVAPAGNFDRIVGFKSIAVQTFDVVTIRSGLQRMEILIDTVHDGLKIEGPVDVFRLLGATVLHVPELRQVYEAQQPENVFPAIRGIYEARKTRDVNVTEIGIRTPSGAITRGKMPTAKEDIRFEKYHKTGAGAVSKIYPYGVIAAWVFGMPKGRATLKLWVSMAQAAASAPIHYGVEIWDATADSDVVQAINKVVKYLT